MALDHLLSFQLYSSRNFPPLDTQLATLARLGFTNIEPFGGLYSDVAGLKSSMDANGLSAVSGHFSLDMLENDIEKAFEIASQLGISIMVCPWLPPEQRPTDTAGWQSLGKRLSTVANKVLSRGFDFAYHNHDFEFFALPDGSLPIQHILADPAIMLELDIAWVVRAGVDPMPWLEGYSNRIICVHVKDVAPEGEKADEGGWADIGTGIVGWEKLWAPAANSSTRLMIAEHDNPSSFERFAGNAASSMRALAGR